MTITIGARLRIDNPSDEVRCWCEDNLVLTNPDYSKKKRMGFWLGNTPPTLTLYEQDGDSLIVPFGCLDSILKFPIDSMNIATVCGDYIGYDCDIPLYDYQEEAVEEMFWSTYGILQSPAGSGKTQMGLALAARFGRRTLWLTHTKDLLTQSKQRAELYMDKNLLGTITEGKVNIGRGITFATIQTMCKLNLEQYSDLWDVIIVDECHRCAGTPTAMTQFSKVLNTLAARHKYGLSATVHRADGMIKATYALLGEVAWQVPEEAVKDNIMAVTVHPVETRARMSRECMDTDGTIIYAKLINYLTHNAPRNMVILANLISNAEHYNLILSDRVEHLQTLMDSLPEQCQAVLITGKTKNAEREQALEDLRTGRKHYLFATYALAKEGLDIPRLDRLYLATPQKDYAVVAQSIGRVARRFDGKEEPICYDYVDDIGYCVKAYKKRCATYKKIGCEVST